MLLVLTQPLLNSQSHVFTLALDLLSTLLGSISFLSLAFRSYQPLGRKHLTEAAGLEVGVSEGGEKETLTIQSLILLFLAAWLIPSRL